MAVGDASSAAGYPLVPNSGEDGKVRWGAREINRTRDLVANLAKKTTSGTAVPSNSVGSDGDIYYKVL